MKVLSENDKNYLLNTIRSIKDFPKPGIDFKDITTLLNDKRAFKFLLDHLQERYIDYDIDFIAAIESRGFIFGAALAARLNLPFVPIRKPGKLPYITLAQKYALEYGVDEIEIHIDAFDAVDEAKVLLIDDLIATGGTAKASVDLINQTKAKCIEACFIVNLVDLGGTAKLENFTEVYSVLEI